MEIFIICGLLGFSVLLNIAFLFAFLDVLKKTKSLEEIFELLKQLIIDKKNLN